MLNVIFNHIQMFGKIIDAIQRPETAFGKNLRDMFILALATGALTFIESFDTIDFGAYDAIVTAIIGSLGVALNRYTRK